MTIKINNEVLYKLEAANIDINEAKIYLLSIYFELRIQKEFYKKTIEQVNSLDIIKVDDINKTVEWLIPLFLNTKSEDSWILDEYRKKFLDVVKDTQYMSKTGTPATVIKKMRDFMREYPYYGKDNILAATDLYLETFNELKYLKQADYFISKGNGISKESTLLIFLEKLGELQKEKKILSKINKKTSAIR